MLKTIGGVNGSSDGKKILEPVVHSLISPKYLSAISWTGRGKKNERKIALSGYVNTLNLITLTLNKADDRFDHLKTITNLKYKILKYAHAKFGEHPKSTYTSVSYDRSGSASPSSSVSR